MGSANTEVQGYRPPTPKSANEVNRYCKIFNCDRRHGNICCTDCINLSSCKNPCLNRPEICGQVKEEETAGEEG